MFNNLYIGTDVMEKEIISKSKKPAEILMLFKFNEFSKLVYT